MKKMMLLAAMAAMALAATAPAMAETKQMNDIMAAVQAEINQANVAAQEATSTAASNQQQDVAVEVDQEANGGDAESGDAEGGDASGGDATAVQTFAIGEPILEHDGMLPIGVIIATDSEVEVQNDNENDAEGGDGGDASATSGDAEGGAATNNNEVTAGVQAAENNAVSANEVGAQTAAAGVGQAIGAANVATQEEVAKKKK